MSRAFPGRARPAAHSQLSARGTWAETDRVLGRRAGKRHVTGISFSSDNESQLGTDNRKFKESLQKIQILRNIFLANPAPAPDLPLPCPRPAPDLPGQG